MHKTFGLLLVLIISTALLQAQENVSYYGEDSELPLKLDHAEPLYIDLIRDLGAHKGEREWNLGFGMFDNKTFDSYEALVEYEWAPIHRLGLEIEVPFMFYSPHAYETKDSIPSSRMEGLQLATQWTFLVSEKLNTSLALGYVHEFEFSDFNNFGTPLIPGMVFNPFIVAAKAFGQHFHTLIYTGPVINQHFADNSFHLKYDINTNVHYMVPNTRNFIGIEFNKSFEQQDFDMTIRPQMRLAISETLLLGIVTGIPVARENQGFSMFTRLIWEPHPKQ